MTKDELLNQIKVDHRKLERYLFYFGRGKNSDVWKRAWLCSAKVK
jgi:hypothetical protein